MLTRFSPSVRVSEDEGKQDKIELDMGDWFIQGIENEIGAFFDVLGPRPREFRPVPENLAGKRRRRSNDAGREEVNLSGWSNIILTVAGHPGNLSKEFFGKIFNRPAGNFSNHTQLQISGGVTDRKIAPIGAPLMKGYLDIQAQAPIKPEYPGDTKRRKIRLRLFLNPTRYLVHQTIPSGTSAPPDQWQLGYPVLTARAKPQRAAAADEPQGLEVETALDSNDNVLIGRRRLSFARPEAWKLHFTRYFVAVEKLIESEFLRSVKSLELNLNGEMFLARSRYYALKKVETYFEFAHDNPIRLIRQLQPILKSIGSSNRTKSYKAQENAEADGDLALIRIKLQGGRMLTAYAKTTHRVRFEIEHDLKNPSVKKLIFAKGGGYTTEDERELLKWFPRLSRDAARCVNEIMDIIQRRRPQGVKSVSTYEFMAEIFEVIKNGRRAKDFIKILVENGCVRVGSRGSDFLPEIRQLRRKGVLEVVAGADNVTPRYMEALNILRQQDGLPPTSLSPEDM